MKQILIETQTFSAKPVKLVEGKGGNSNLLVEGILATAEVKNGNGRYYSRDLWEREIDKYMDSVKHNRALGELDHPDSSIINLKNVSHNIKKIWWDGDHVMGAIEILPTPSGNILAALFQNNIPVGVSSRGMGSLKQMGELMEVQDDFELLCWDFVSTPSNPGSYMKERGMMNESKTSNQHNQYTKVNSIITDILCANGTCPIF
jgi:hypothetical protein